MSNARNWIAAMIVAAVGGAILLTGASGAGENKEIRDGIDKIATTLQKGDKDGAKKEAMALVKRLKLEDVADAMDLFKPRAKHGFGVGEKGSFTPDGIEQAIAKFYRDAPAAGTLSKNSVAFEQMGYRIAALGLVASARPPEKFMKDQSPKDWSSWSNDTVEGGLALATAAKAKVAPDIKSAASKLYSTCNSCHTKFRN
jgi:hypothetical protein